MEALPRVLYIEDNDDNIAMLKLRLEIEGFEVLVARDARTGLAMIEREHPDVVLMDLDLPDMDGWQATRRIRATRSAGELPVIALSAHAMTEHRVRAIEAGCNEFQTKPVEFQQLLCGIRTLLTRRTTAGSATFGQAAACGNDRLSRPSEEK